MIKYLKYCLLPLMVLAFAAMMNGCGGGAEKTASLARLDSLQTALNKLETGLKSIDREQVKDNYVTVKDNLQKIYVIFQDDPLAVQEELLLNYEKMKVNLNRLVLDIDNIEKEIQFGLQQISIHKESLNKGDSRTEELQQYCRSESDAIRSLDLILGNKTKEWSNMQEQIKKYEPEIKNLLRKK